MDHDRGSAARGGLDSGRTLSAPGAPRASGVLVAWALAAVSGCADGGCAEEPQPAPAPTVEAPAPAVEAPEPEPLPPFDFRRLVLEPDRYRASTRTCDVLGVGEPARDEDGVSRRRVRCANGAAGYEVDVRFDAPVPTAELAPPVGDPPQDRWLELLVEGISADRTRGRAVYRRVRTVDRPEPAPRGAAGPSDRAGLDFSRVATEPGLIGARRSCAVRAATVIVRRAEGDTELPPDIVATMPVTCTHRGGRSSTELAFTRETAAHALLVGAGAMAHGVVESPRRLRVTHVTPPGG